MKNQQLKKISVGKSTFMHYDYEDCGVKGVGKHRHPIISMDPFINHDQDEQLHIECCKGLALSDDYKTAMTFGAMPPEEVHRLHGFDSWSSMLANIHEYDPNGHHRRAIEELMDNNHPDRNKHVYKYLYYAVGAAIPWFFACYLKQSDFATKSSGGEWLPSAKFFPNVLKYLDTLPFKSIGRVLFFTSYPNAGVIIHRDMVVTEHRDHNINLWFDGGWRPSFIWDTTSRSKIYLEEGSRSYFFNNRDYHGVDPEPTFRYTLRIDGTFTDELCDQLGLIDGYTWKWDYERKD